VVKVSNDDAFANARLVARLEGVPVGISSGAALQAAVVVGSRKENAGKNMVVIPSFAERYLDVLFEDWAEAGGAGSHRACTGSYTRRHTWRLSGRGCAGFGWRGL
jgi:hypothetical protein